MMKKMQRRAVSRFSVISLILLAGCEYTDRLMRPASLTERSEINAVDPKEKPLNLDTFRFSGPGAVTPRAATPGAATPGAATPDADASAAAAPEADASKATDETAYVQAIDDPVARDRLQDVLIERSDVACAAFQDKMFARVATRKVGLTSLALFTSTAAAILGGDTSGRILAGVGAAAVGSDAILDAEVLQNHLITIIISQMNTSRTTIQSEIEGRRREDGQRATTSDYTVDAAMRDAGRYHAACGFLPAVVALADKAKTPVPTAASIVAQREALEEELAVLDKKLVDGLNPNIENIYNDRMLAIRDRLSVLSNVAPLIE